MIIMNLFGSTLRLYGDVLSQASTSKIKEFIDSNCDNGGFNIVQDFDRHSSLSLVDMLETGHIDHVSIRIDIKVGETFTISEFGKMFRK